MFKRLFSFIRDPGIIDGYVVLYPKDDPYLLHRTRTIPEGPAPKVIIFKKKIYTDTKRYDANGFRIYIEDEGVYRYTSFNDDYSEDDWTL
jgi:hypothetical protein